jgi:nucleotide-binding universal stress UspA family protein
MTNVWRSPVVAGIDGSPSGAQALIHAGIEARLHGWPLLLVYAEPDIRHDPRRLSLHRRYGAALLAESAQRARRQQPTVTVGTRLGIGAPAPVLLDASVGAGLVVVGNRGYGPFEELFARSVSVRVAAHAAAPVMVVRGPELVLPPRLSQLPVVVGVDGSRVADEAVEFAAQEARLRGVPLLAVHSTVGAPLLVGAGGGDPLDSGPLGPSAVPTSRLTVHRHSVDVDPRTALVAASADAALLVVGSRGHGSLAGLLLSSVGQALIHHAHCPVVVVPAGVST